jgi:hypothetical protein
MSKLRLNLDALTVETFVAQEDAQTQSSTPCSMYLSFCVAECGTLDVCSFDQPCEPQPLESVPNCNWTEWC